MILLYHFSFRFTGRVAFPTSNVMTVMAMSVTTRVVTAMMLATVTSTRVMSVKISSGEGGSSNTISWGWDLLNIEGDSPSFRVLFSVACIELVILSTESRRMTLVFFFPLEHWY
eukprot:TRINITY_DN1650_c0_g1_i1.p1 TRINITY_DN1650_c0_g1~~TRINITY_DN1650_c0_g1_i1.p1  ORF type:complete len:114 (-),score=19.34 TRINITY_DN1650_c0_g1_i1:841-1182(-)